MDCVVVSNPKEEEPLKKKDLLVMMMNMDHHIVTLERKIYDDNETISKLEKEPCCDLTSNRELIGAERANELFEKCYPNTKSIVLGTKSFDKGAALNAAEKIKSLEHLSYADLSDIIAGRPEAEALEVLQIICGALPKSILALDLSENALGEKGIRAIREAVSQLDSLEEISFQNNGLSELSIHLLSEYLPTQNLKKLIFHNNMSGSGGAKGAAAIVLKCSQLVEFRMSSSRVAADGGCELIPALGGQCNLRKLNLSDSMFDKKCAQLLLNNFGQYSFLTDLILRDTGLGDASILSALANSKILPMLSVLDISGLELEAEAGTKVGDIIKNRLRLRKLWLDDNELESAGVRKLCRRAGTGSFLEFISVQSCGLGSVGGVALAKFAASANCMKTINASGNMISESGVDSMNGLLSDGNIELILDENEPDDDCDEDEEEEEDDDGSDTENDDVTDETIAMLASKLTI